MNEILQKTTFVYHHYNRPIVRNLITISAIYLRKFSIDKYYQYDLLLLFFL